MRRHLASAVAVAAATVLLAGCGGQSAYCSTVEENTETLNSFGKTRTTEAYQSYAETFRTVASEAPAAVEDDWMALAEATEGVLAAQEDVGLALQDMQDEEKVAELEEGQLSALNESYEAFNDTTDQRTAVVKNVKTECEITLK